MTSLETAYASAEHQGEERVASLTLQVRRTRCCFCEEEEATVYVISISAKARETASGG
jgi:hypothetical protein